MFFGYLMYFGQPYDDDDEDDDGHLLKCLKM